MPAVINPPSTPDDPGIVAAANWLADDDSAYETAPDHALRTARGMLAAATEAGWMSAGEATRLKEAVKDFLVEPYCKDRDDPSQGASEHFLMRLALLRFYAGLMNPGTDAELAMLEKALVEFRPVTMEQLRAALRTEP